MMDGPTTPAAQGAEEAGVGSFSSNREEPEKEEQLTLV